MAEFNPDEYLQQVKAKQFNPDTYLQQVKATKQAQSPQQIPDAADKAAQNNSPNAQPTLNQGSENVLAKIAKNYAQYMGGVTSGGIKGLTLGNYDPLPELRQGSTAAGIGGGIGQLVGGGEVGAGLAGLAGPAAGLVGSIAQNTGIGAALGGLSKPQEGQDRMSNALMGGAVGGVASGALGVGGALAKWFGDKAMKASVGIKDVPGVGTRLADMGLIGTKNQMANQVTQKLPQAENEVQAVIGDIEGSAPGSEITNAVSGKGTKFINPDTGLPFEGKETSYNQVRDLADKLSRNDSYSPEALLKLKRASDYEGYTASGTPATSLKAELEQAQANKARELLDNMSSGASKEALANEQALLLAKKPLDKATSIPSSLAGLFFQKAPALAGSALGQAGTKAGQAATSAADPALLQTLFGANRGSQ